MDSAVKSLVSAKLKKNQFFINFKLPKEKDNPSPSKNNPSNWQYSILSTSREIEPFLILTSYSFKIGWWRQTEIAAQATSTGVANWWHCLYRRRSLRRAVSMTVCASEAVAVTNNHQRQPSPCGKLSLRTILLFRNCFLSIALFNKLNPSGIRSLIPHRPCWRSEEAGEILLHDNCQIFPYHFSILSRNKSGGRKSRDSQPKRDCLKSQVYSYYSKFFWTILTLVIFSCKNILLVCTDL